MEQKNPLGELPVPVLLRRYALPSILAMLVSALYNIVDSMFVAKLNEEALESLVMRQRM